MRALPYFKKKTTKPGEDNIQTDRKKKKKS
jgi:hypothetical protein